MIVLYLIWVIIMLGVAGTVFFPGHLPYTGAFMFAICITFIFLFAKKWLLGIIGLCVCSVLFYGVYSFEPNWLNVLLHLWNLVQ